jgi:hypothetical protein
LLGALGGPGLRREDGGVLVVCVGIFGSGVNMVTTEIPYSEMRQCLIFGLLSLA